VAEAEAVYGPGVFDYSETEYTYAHDNVKIRCCACDFVFSRTPASHLQKHDCPKCCERRQVSKAETEWLDSLGVKDRQHRVRMTGRKALIVDGYDPSTNTVYAFLGSFWHADPRTMKQDEIHPLIGRLNKNVYEDTIKQIEDMKANGYNVVHMWEYDWTRAK
jgi:G:T-mismatch repair DNA endonuclease (very short patch repair protein)